jgi:signal transduction histidine kinase
MPLAHDILLLHEAGPDRQAVASYLERQGLTTLVCDDTRQALTHLGRDPVNTKAIVLAHQTRLAGAAEGSVESLRGYRTILIVPAGSEPLPGFEQTIREPFFLDQLVNAIKGSSGTREGRAPAAPAPGTARHPDSDLLRGLAHAVNNPLTAALGWLRLLESEIDEGDQRRRLVGQARTELDRLAQVAMGLAALAGTASSGGIPFDLAQGASDCVRAATAQGARAAFRTAGGRSFLVNGNPVEYDLFLKLLLVPAHDASGLDQIEIVVSESAGVVHVAVNDPRGRVPDLDSLADVGRLLRAERHHRALGIALGSALARRAGGTFRCEAGNPRGASFVLAVPAAAGRTDAMKGAR